MLMIEPVGLAVGQVWVFGPVSRLEVRVREAEEDWL